MSSRELTLRLDDELLLVWGFQAAGWLRAANCKPLYAARHRAYMVDADRLPDLLAYLESRRVPVRMIEDVNGGDAA